MKNPIEAVGVINNIGLVVKESQFLARNGWEFEELPSGNLRVWNASSGVMYTLAAGRWEARHEKLKPATERDKKDRLK